MTEASVTDGANSTVPPVVPIVVSLVALISLVIIGFVIRKRLQRTNDNALASQLENAAVRAAVSVTKV
jgi:hypothetical protein